jgi:MYXO-CTERM domain-containing protein
MQLRSGAIALALGVVCLPSLANAHIRLTFPKPRHAGASPPLKEQPCGVGNEKRSNIINYFKPGEMITVTWNEFIPHPGHFRIAFLADGDAFPEPTSFTDIRKPETPPILADGIGGSGSGGNHQMQIKLPNIECSNCTLQILQVMTDKPPYTQAGPVGNPPGDDVYHECADIVLSNAVDGGAPADAGRDAGGMDAGRGGAGGAGGSGGTGGGGGTGGAGGGSGGSGGSSGSGGATGGSGGTTGYGGSGGSTGGSGGSSPGGTGGTTQPPPKGGGGGCAYGGTSPSGGLTILVALAILTRRRRR